MESAIASTGKKKMVAKQIARLCKFRYVVLWSCDEPGKTV
jgi:hypothetical protein